MDTEPLGLIHVEEVLQVLHVGEIIRNVFGRHPLPELPHFREDRRGATAAHCLCSGPGGRTFDHHHLLAGPRPLGIGFAQEEIVMQCVICKRGRVAPGKTQAELKVGSDHLLVPVDAEICAECGEAYYSTDTMRYLERVREDFVQKTIAPPSIGRVYQVS
jgi:YgiT-type zinc finger domain-containing protein